MMIYYMMVYSYYTHNILRSCHGSYFVVFLFSQSSFGEFYYSTPHRSAGQAGPQSARASGGGSACYLSLLYGNFMATLWVILVMMVMMVIMGHKKGHTGGIVGSKFITTGGIVCCLSCLLLQLYPSVGSLRSLRSRRSQVSCHLWKGAWRLRGRPGGLPQEDAQLERMGPGWGPDGARMGMIRMGVVVKLR